MANLLRLKTSQPLLTTWKRNVANTCKIRQKLHPTSRWSKALVMASQSWWSGQSVACLLATHTVLFRDFGRAPCIMKGAVCHCVALMWPQTAAVAPSGFLSSSALSVLGISSSGFVVRWQDEDDKDDNKLEKSDADKEAATGFCCWRSAYLHYERQFFDRCKRPLVFSNLNWPPIGLISAASSIGGCNDCWESCRGDWVPCAIKYCRRKHGFNHRVVLSVWIQFMQGFSFGIFVGLIMLMLL